MWNGSRLAKELSANTFNDYWNGAFQPDVKEALAPLAELSLSKDTGDQHTEDVYRLFDLSTTDKHDGGLIGTLE